jgi:hypothetical protein
MEFTHPKGVSIPEARRSSLANDSFAPLRLSENARAERAPSQEQPLPIFYLTTPFTSEVEAPKRASNGHPPPRPPSQELFIGSLSKKAGNLYPEGVSLSIKRHSRSRSVPHNAFSAGDNKANLASSNAFQRSQVSSSGSMGGYRPQPTAHAQSSFHPTRMQHTQHSLTQQQPTEQSSTYLPPFPSPSPSLPPFRGPQESHGSSPLQGLLSSYRPPPASALAPAGSDSMHASLREAAEMARLGSHRIAAAYSAAHYLLKQLQSQSQSQNQNPDRRSQSSSNALDSQEILAEMMACLDKARDSLEHIEASTAASLPPATAASATGAVDRMSELELMREVSSQHSEEGQSSHEHKASEYDCSPGSPRSLASSSQFKPSTPWRSSLRDRAQGAASSMSVDYIFPEPNGKFISPPLCSSWVA